MRVDFLDEPPLTCKNIFATSLTDFKPKYIAVSEDNKCWNYQLEYKHQIEGWESILITAKLIAVRSEHGLYLFDAVTHEQKNFIEIPDGFEQLYFNGNEIFITGPLCIYCITDAGALKWESEQLGIDGVVIDSFNANQIVTSAQHDPPDGWRRILLDRETGIVLNSTYP